MRKRGFAATAAAAALWVGCGALAAVPQRDPPPPWAFILMQGGDPNPPGTRITVPGSTVHLTEKQLDDPFNLADWFPEDHPPLPEVVSYGRRPQQYPCAYCHFPTGIGDSASAALAGLPAAYIEQQLAEFRTGRRRCAVAKAPCGTDMLQIARLVSAADAKAAAVYFSKLRYHPRVRVVEAAMVPKTRYGSLFPIRLTGGGEEPIGMRILQMPDSAALEYDGDWRVPVTAYVPPGSLALGKRLVRSGAGALPCASCHGARLQGVGMAPPLAGRPPTYIVRQLYDIQYGYRRGPAVALMEPEVAHMTARDRIAIAAYIAALRPGAR